MALVLVAMIAFGTTACGGLKKADANYEDYDLVVSYYSGAYGDEWIKQSAKEFETDKGVKVLLVPCSDQDCGAINNLKSGKNLSDVYIGSFAQWPSWVQNGYVENLKSVYDTKVKTSKGEVKISDYIDKDNVGKYVLERQLGTGDSYPWAIPWSAMPMSLAYNADVLKTIPHVSSGKVSSKSVDSSTKKWIAPPQNLTEWLALCDDIKAYKSTDGHTYAPFGWSAVAAEQIYYFMFTWWAQYQGLNKSNVKGQGSFYDFWNFGNTAENTYEQTFSFNVFDQKGLAVSLDNIRKLIVDEKAQTYKNSLSKVNTLDSKGLSRSLYAEMSDEKPVIAVASSFGESEARLGGYWDSNSDGKRDSDIRFMNIPSLDGHENEKYLYCANSDMMFIPYQAKNKDLGKDFLVFLCNEDQLKKFTIRSMGGLRPFNYDAREIEDDSITDYIKSVFEVYYNSTRIYDFPMNAYRNNPFSVSLIYSYEHPIPLGTLGPGNVINTLKKQSGATIMKDVKEKFEILNKEAFKKKYGMTETK